MPCAQTRSTCAITKPLEFFAAIASARLSSVSASRSIVMLPETSAVVPRMSATEIGKRLVEEPLLAVDLHHAHEVVARALVDAPALLARIDEGAQAHLGQRAGAVAGDVAEQLRERAERQVVGLDLARRPRAPTSLGTRLQWPPIARLHEPFVREPVEAALLAVAGRGGEHAA